MVKILAFVSGCVNGAFGIGGGTVALPMLEKYLKDKERAQRSVCLFIIPLALLSIAMCNETADIKTVLSVSLGGLLGGGVGGYIANKVKAFYLRIVFALIIVYIGVKGVL